jgi:hypothetical protein
MAKLTTTTKIIKKHPRVKFFLKKVKKIKPVQYSTAECTIYRTPTTTGTRSRPTSLSRP